MLYQTTQEHEALRAKVREFAEAEIKPIAFMLDKNNQFPTQAVQKMGELGLMGLPYETEYGGAGLDALSYAIAVEELARVDGGAGVILSAHTSLAPTPSTPSAMRPRKRNICPTSAPARSWGPSASPNPTQAPTPAAPRPPRRIWGTTTF